MTFRHLLCASALVLPTAAAPLSRQHVDTVHSVSLSDTQSPLAEVPRAPWAVNDPADSLYTAALDALNKKNYRRAATLFEEVSSRYPKSAYAPDAYYWRAFALYRIGRDEDLRDALKSIEEQQRRFPKATTTSDARTLAVRIRGALAKGGDASAAESVSTLASRKVTCPAGGNGRGEDDDVRTAALNALLQMNAEEAVPILEQVLQRRDACSEQLRAKAVFLVAQKPTSRTESMLLDVVRNDPSSEVRESGVFWLGQVHTDRAAAALEELATSSPDLQLRDKAVFALGQQNSARSEALVRRIAESDATPESAREQAIFQIGQRASHENAEFLRSLFAKVPRGERNDEYRKRILFSLSQMPGQGNDRWLLSVALDNSQTVEVRKHALFTAGQANLPGSEFAALYDRLTDPEIKQQLIWVLSESRDKGASDKLVEIAQKDKDPEMRKKAIFWLGQKNDPRIRQILLDIINKG
jgi:HEAT repeat protein